MVLSLLIYLVRILYFWSSISVLAVIQLHSVVLCAGAPKLDVTWLRDKEPLHFLTPRFRTFEESGVYTLVMSNVTEKEAGFYTCRASNTYGHADTSANVGIVLPGSVRGGKPAMFINRPDTDMSVAVGEDISVSFRVTGDPKPKGKFSYRMIFYEVCLRKPLQW